MANYFFIGDGTEVLACEAYHDNAMAELAKLRKEHPDESLSIYERDPSEVTQDSAGKPVWAYPSERAMAEKYYELPTLEEAVAG